MHFFGIDEIEKHAPQLYRAIRVARAEIYNRGDDAYIIERRIIKKVKIWGLDVHTTQWSPESTLWFEYAYYYITPAYYSIGTPFEFGSPTPASCVYREYKRAVYALRTEIYMDSLHK